ncbi:hypothetical protein [Paracoccus aestuariivivens]|uniref:Uncharacterized protein n=1 Tax=Paracoccus aestuariivivens TaxID=1820333 RepID=A0A6L6JH02_9RHOB|nr:hypothetical protein [Paracoccus aestuariivivens]MTH79404.1 hypothetical protein [Paracoccus aestuariivivens]
MDAVRVIVDEVAAETGISAADICSKDKTRLVLMARRTAMRRARSAGVSSVVIAAVIGCNGASVRKMMLRNQELQNIDLGSGADEMAELVRPFQRPSGRVSPLTLQDYASRAGLSAAAAKGALAKLIACGKVERAGRGTGVTIYDWCGA